MRFMSLVLLLNMDKRIVNFVLCGVVFVLLIQIVSANIIATIGMQGLSMASPEAGEIVSNVICLSNPVGCVAGKVVGMVKSEALNVLAEQNPEIAQVVVTYNQVQGYVDMGAEVTQDLEVNEGGEVESGAIQFGEEGGRFGNLVGKDIEQDEIYGKEIGFEKGDGMSTITFNGENSYINVKGDLFKDVKTGDENIPAYLKMDESGVVREADLTADKDTFFVLNDKRVDVPEGTRIHYEDGEMIVLGKKGDEISLADKTADENGEYTFSNANKIKILDENGDLWIKGDKIIGTEFQVDDVVVKGIGEGYGELTIVPEGYLLGKKSVGEWRDLVLVGEEDVLLARSSLGIDNYDNWVLPGMGRFRAKGENFEILFDEGNEWANVEDIDWFRIKAGKGFEMDMQNREADGLIPKMVLDGDFNVLQDHKEIFMEEDKIMVKAHKYESWLTDAYLKEEIGEKEFFGVHIKSYTSPVEILMKDDSGFLDKKVIVSNFKGFGIADLNADKVILEESYAKSNLFKEVDNTLAFNYPSVKDFEKISGKGLVFFPGEQEITLIQGPFYKPEIVRTFIDYWESLPEASKEGISRIVISGQKMSNKVLLKGPGAYLYDHNTVHFRWDDMYSESIDDPETEYATFRHELTHANHDFIEGRESSRNVRSSKNINEWAELWDKEKDLEDSIDALSLKSDDEVLKGMLSKEDEIYKKMYRIEVANMYSGVAEIKEKVPEYRDLWDEDGVLRESIDEHYKKSSDDVLRGMWMEKVEIGKKMRENSNKLFGPYAPDSEFTKGWVEAVGEGGYDKAVTKVTKGSELISFKWADGSKSSSPQQGFVRAYGATSLNEDVATHVEKIVSEPGFFRENGLIGEGSVYREKIDLLYENGLISEGEYEAVFE